MDTQAETSPLWYTGLFLYQFVAYGLAYGIHRAKQTCQRRCSPSGGSSRYTPVSGTTTMNITATCNNFTTGVSKANGAANRQSRVLGWNERTQEDTSETSGLLAHGDDVNYEQPRSGARLAPEDEAGNPPPPPPRTPKASATSGTHAGSVSPDGKHLNLAGAPANGTDGNAPC